MKTKKFIPIHEIEFENHAESMKNKSYPNSGLFLVKITDGIEDLRFVDKSMPTNLCICPKSVFFGEVSDQITTIEELPTIEQVKPVSGFSENDFILDFTKILLNRK